MTRKFGVAGIVMGLALVLTGCPEVPPGYQAPWVESSEVSPQPAQPGDSVTFLLQARDDHGVTAAALRYLVTPSGTLLPATQICSLTHETQSAPTHALVTVVCELPTFASNGTWALEIRLSDSNPPGQNYPGSVVRVPFDVTGGSNDREAPQLVSYSTSPAVIDQGTTFALTIRVRDESQPIIAGPRGSGIAVFWLTKLFSPNSSFMCTNTAITPVSATDVDVRYNCVPLYYNHPEPVEAGTYRAAPTFRDALEHEANIEVSVNVQPLAG